MASDHHVISFRVTDREYATITQAADDAGVSISEFVRRAAMVHVSGVGSLPIRSIPNTSATFPFLRAQLTSACANTSALDGLVQEDYRLTF